MIHLTCGFGVYVNTFQICVWARKNANERETERKTETEAKRDRPAHHLSARACMQANTSDRPAACVAKHKSDLTLTAMHFNTVTNLPRVLQHKSRTSHLLQHSDRSAAYVATHESNLALTTTHRNILQHSDRPAACVATHESDPATHAWLQYIPSLR